MKDELVFGDPILAVLEPDIRFVGVEVESDRLPPRRSTTLLGIERDLVLGSPHDHFTAAILCYLMGARHA